MSLTIDLPEETLQALEERARSLGVSAEAYARELLRRELAGPNSKDLHRLQTVDPKTWGDRLDEWLDSQDPDRPVLSDRDLERENLYADLGFSRYPDIEVIVPTDVEPV